MRGLVELAVRRRVTVVMTALAVAAFGTVGYSRLYVELFPDISYPSITVQTNFPDTAPQEVEYLVTQRVEEAVGVLHGLKTVHSVSRAGVSEVSLEFDWGSDMDMLSLEVREKLDRLVLPEDAEKPIVLRFDPSFDPILRIALSGDEDLAAMRYLAERRIKQRFETLEGVASAQIKGGLEDEIQIDVDQENLAAMRISLERIREVVSNSNVNLPGGALRGDERQYLIRTMNEFTNIEEIRDLIVATNESAVVRLRDVAEVRWGAKEREEITRVDGKESVEISLYKEGDANTVAVARTIRKELETWQASKLPDGYTLTLLFDQSSLIEQSVKGVRDAALIGGILAILVLMAFLKDLRSTIIIATSIPFSIIATFLLMYRFDISLNIMSLGGLTLGIGMLVDNSIVVLESIFRRRRQGLPLPQAAIQGTCEVGAAVVASTLTTVAVFLPIIFVEGIAGQLFRDQAVTVTISLLASLIIAVTMIPMLSAIGQRSRAEVKASAAPEDAQMMTLGAFSKIYDRLLGWSLDRGWITIAIALLCLVASMAGFGRLGTELIPVLSEGEFFFEVKMPEGTSLRATDRIVAQMESAAAGIDTIDTRYSVVGSRLVAGGMTMNTKGENLAQLNVVMKDRSDDEAEARAIESLRAEFRDTPDLEIKFGRPSYFTLKTPVEVIAFGENLETLQNYSLDLAESLRSVPGLVDVRSSLEAGNPELQIKFHRERLASLDLQMRPLSDTVKGRVQGVVPTRFKDRDRQIDIRIRNSEEDRSSVEDIRRLVVPGETQPIRLLTVAEVVHARGPAEVHRVLQQRAAVITANVKGRGLRSVIADVKEVIRQAPEVAGISTELGGQNQEMEESFESLLLAIVLAVFLVYLVMASTFESFLHPLIVLFTIPLSLVGVTAGLLLTNTKLSVIVLIGFVMLIGIVVNNAIVLIDAINRMRQRGLDKRDAVRRAAHTRLRPIVMTTLTTILGLLPMAISWGEGSELRAPLAITVASGLLVSSLLTLVVIPAVYILVPSRVAASAAATESLDDRNPEASS